jgi:predicted nucleic acid-binding protein
MSCYATLNINVITVDSSLFHKALDFYSSRHDKSWGLTDCISFVVMQEYHLTEALTNDRHFNQVGFNALLLSL